MQLLLQSVEPVARRPCLGLQWDVINVPLMSGRSSFTRLPIRMQSAAVGVRCLASPGDACVQRWAPMRGRLVTAACRAVASKRSRSCVELLSACCRLRWIAKGSVGKPCRQQRAPEQALDKRVPFHACRWRQCRTAKRKVRENMHCLIQMMLY